VRVRLGQTGSAEQTTCEHSRDDPLEDVGVCPVEFQLNSTASESIHLIYTVDDLPRAVRCLYKSPIR